MNQCTAIVTGASRGIGRAIAVALGGLGYNVVINYHVNEEAARQTAQQVQQAGGQAEIVPADIGNLADHHRLLDAAVQKFRGVHLLVNNAGVAPKIRADLLEVNPESFDDVLDTNLKGTFFCTQLVAKHMIAQAQAESPDTRPPRSIITISSISAQAASVNRGEYCIAKAGLAMLTKLFAVRLAEYGINVFEIRPGIITTDMTSDAQVKAKYDRLIFEGNLLPVPRWGTPADVARAVAAIAGGMFPYSTGQVFEVAGGFHISSL